MYIFFFNEYNFQIKRNEEISRHIKAIAIISVSNCCNID